MKKLLLILLCTFSYTSVYAYSQKIIPGGESIGINISTKGVLITSFYYPSKDISSETLLAGDFIMEVNGYTINNIDNLMQKIRENVNDKNEVNLTINRNGKSFITKLTLKKEKDVYKTGLYVKDEITGIGTLSYIDPETKVYGALGHEIRETNTSKRIEVKEGTIFKSDVTSIDKSTRGNPGGKNATFYKDKVLGDIKKNKNTGIFGSYSSNLDKDVVNIASLDEVKLGKAYIKTVLSNNKIENYEINITKIEKENNTKNIIFTVTDKKLLSKTGGIVQGMSGSPIMQDNKIIGVVSHVVVDNPQNGYGISIIKMLEEGDKLK